MPKKSTDINFRPPRRPKFIDDYLKQVILEAPKGIDWEINSAYMKSKLDNFPWDAYNYIKPDLNVFSRWVLAKRKQGLNIGNKNKKIRASTVVVKEKLKETLIQKTLCYVNPIQDSFIGSKKYLELAEEFAVKYSVSIDVYTGVLISRRKRTLSVKSDVKIYSYFPRPKSRPNDIKLGHTKNCPYKRMHDETRNTRTEPPQMIGWFLGNKSDEQAIIDHFSEYKVLEMGNQEMFNFPDVTVLIDHMKKQVLSCKGTMAIKDCS